MEYYTEAIYRQIYVTSLLAAFYHEKTAILTSIKKHLYSKE
jgi:hypothetical protein